MKAEPVRVTRVAPGGRPTRGEEERREMGGVKVKGREEREGGEVGVEATVRVRGEERTREAEGGRRQERRVGER